ncbi:MAG: hypothetical protein CMN32_05715 [Saprospirales bacterium]|nr:hypothetical protein [Saprospirales bacterium]
MARILMTAYAANPYKGSEDGSGWNIIRHVAEHVDVVAITRENNRPHIEQFMAENRIPSTPGRQLHFEYFDLPYWMRFWKKGGRGAMLYHYLWHFGVVFFILKKGIRFDIAHHLNFHNDWTPSFLWLLGKPLVWGPIGHHHKIPSEFLKPYGFKAWLNDRILWWLKKAFWTLDPFLKITKWTSGKILCMNSSVDEVLHVPAEKHVLIPPTATEEPPQLNIETDDFRVISVGRFVPLKGFDVTVRAFARFYHRQPAVVQRKLKLTLIGKGPEEQRLRRMIKEEQLPDGVVEIIPWIERSELPKYYASSKAFFFPSHEGAGMVVVEALSYGLPVVCFNNYGPGEFTDDGCAIRVNYDSYEACLDRFAEGLERLLYDEKFRKSMGENARKRYRNLYTYEAKAIQIVEVYGAVKSGMLEQSQNVSWGTA